VDGDRRLITVSLYRHSESLPTELTCWDAETGKRSEMGGLLARPNQTPRVVASPRGDWFATCGHWGPPVWRTADNGKKAVLLSDQTGHRENRRPSPSGQTVLHVSRD